MTTEAHAGPGVEDLPPKLRRVRRWCRRAAKPAKPVELDMEDGSKAVALEVEHGDHGVWAIDGPEEVVDLVYAFHLTPEEVDHLQDLDDEELRTLIADLEMVLLEGRSAYRFYEDADGRFSGYSLTQVLHVPDDPDDATQEARIQRLSDAVQELINVALRGANLLGLPWQDVQDRPQRGVEGPHPGMYG